MAQNIKGRQVIIYIFYYDTCIVCRPFISVYKEKHKNTFKKVQNTLIKEVEWKERQNGGNKNERPNGRRRVW